MNIAPLDPVDDWTEVASPTLRRVLQNRLNQRASRQRRLDQEKSTGVVRRRRGRPKSKSTLQENEEEQPVVVAHAGHVAVYTHGIHATDRDLAQIMKSLAASVLANLCIQNPSADVVLLPLTKLNSLRGVLANMDTLGIDIPEMEDDDAISSFNKAWNQTSRQALMIPPSLRPTEYQISQSHHPWYDILPFPKLRETLIARQDEYDDLELCIDMLGLHGGNSVGLLVWRDPWDPEAWEMTEEFVRKWGWLFKSSLELQSSTARWRLLRGERAIVELLDG